MKRFFTQTSISAGGRIVRNKSQPVWLRNQREDSELISRAIYSAKSVSNGLYDTLGDICGAQNNLLKDLQIEGRLRQNHAAVNHPARKWPRGNIDIRLKLTLREMLCDDEPTAPLLALRDRRLNALIREMLKNLADHVNVRRNRRPCTDVDLFETNPKMRKASAVRIDQRSNAVVCRVGTALRPKSGTDTKVTATKINDRRRRSELPQPT